MHSGWNRMRDNNRTSGKNIYGKKGGCVVGKKELGKYVFNDSDDNIEPMRFLWGGPLTPKSNIGTNSKPRQGQKCSSNK
jgi:hypothetical protein